MVFTRDEKTLRLERTNGIQGSLQCFGKQVAGTLKLTDVFGALPICNHPNHIRRLGRGELIGWCQMPDAKLDVVVVVLIGFDPDLPFRGWSQGGSGKIQLAAAGTQAEGC